MEAELKKDADLVVEKVNGSLGELRVEVEGSDEVRTGLFSYPGPSKVVAQVRERLGRSAT